ncbi:TPA: hypothetical protein L5A09_006682 [Pseudomonas aeruginosa]|nr:hypothetical protein [Pseudomonas aeruginosa]
MADNWEVALISAIERELVQLEWLINCEQAGEEDVEGGDVLAQISRIGGLTDLVYADGLPLSETTRAKLGQQSERVMQMARDRSFGR